MISFLVFYPISAIILNSVKVKLFHPSDYLKNQSEVKK